MSELNIQSSSEPASSGRHSVLRHTLNASIILTMLLCTGVHYWFSLAIAVSALDTATALNSVFRFYFFGGAAFLILVNCVCVCGAAFKLLNLSLSIPLSIALVLGSGIVSSVGWFAVFIAVSR